jgi:hypothetical protein
MMKTLENGCCKPSKTPREKRHDHRFEDAMTERRAQLIRLVTRIEQQINEAEAMTVQPGDDAAMRYASAVLNKMRAALRRLDMHLKHEKSP